MRRSLSLAALPLVLLAGCGGGGSSGGGNPAPPANAQQIVQDKDDNPVFMAPSSYMLDLERRNNPEITFHTTSEFKTAIAD